MAKRLVTKTRLMRCAIAGMTQAEAARALGCDRSHISRMSHKFEIQLASPCVGETWPKIRELAEAGLNRKEIAARLGVSRRKVDYFAQMNPDVRITPIRRRDAKPEPKRIDYTEGMSAAQRADYAVLTKRGGMAAEEARATVLRPRKKLSALPPASQRRGAMTALERLREGARA